MIVDLLHNATLLISLSVFYSLLVRFKPSKSIYFKIYSGILFGLIAVIGMRMPLHHQQGIIYDGRSIILSLAGLFGGGITATIAIVLAEIYRWHIGGIGVLAGSVSMLISAMIGLVIRRISKNNPENLSVLSFLGMGIVVTLGMLLSQLLLPWPLGIQIINQIWFPVMVVFVPVSFVVGVLLGSEERRIKAELKTIESERKFREIFNSTSEAIFIHDAKTNRIIDLNERTLRMYGYFNKEEIINGNIGDLSAGEPHYTEELAQKKMRKTITDGPQSFYWHAKKKNGETFWIELSIRQTIIDEQDCLIAVARDITVRMQALVKLKKKNEEYETLNEELSESLSKIQLINEELEQAKIKAEESDRLKSAFLANMSHEIRTPMNGILGFANLLEDPELTEDLQQQYISIIRESGDRLLNIINDLINISKIEVGEMIVKTDPVHLNLLFDSLHTFFTPEAEKKNLCFTHSVGLSKEECVIISDKTKLTQIISNLIKNALKFTKKGTVEFGYSLSDSTLEFYVKDTGIGVDPELYEKIFERFRQANLNPTRSEEGAGLGLSISKAYVEMLGGRIWLESECGKGSVFYFTIPYIQNN
ncbi:MAG: ATP-binding protein [Bacteroidota bacterium]|nr:ATP-binding protein [Bacteroidota bacterium]